MCRWTNECNYCYHLYCHPSIKQGCLRCSSLANTLLLNCDFIAARLRCSLGEFDHTVVQVSGSWCNFRLKWKFQSWSGIYNLVIDSCNYQLYIKTLLIAFQFCHCFQSVYIKTVFNIWLKSRIASGTSTCVPCSNNFSIEHNLPRPCKTCPIWHDATSG